MKCSWGRGGQPGSLGIHLAALGVLLRAFFAHDQLRGFRVLFSLGRAGGGEGSGLCRDGLQGQGEEPVSMNIGAERSPWGLCCGGTGGQTGTAVSAPPPQPPGTPTPRGA